MDSYSKSDAADKVPIVPGITDKVSGVASDTIPVRAFSPEAAVQQPPLKVAVVEDAGNIRLRLVQLVDEAGGMQVVGEADSEDQAIEICRKMSPDAIVLDMQLAQGSGLGVLKAMGYGESRTRPAIIVLTNFPSPVVERAARALGAEWFLDKSSEFDQLSRILRVVSGRQHTADAK